MIYEWRWKKNDKLARRYGVKKILLFGSSLSGDNKAQDIDLAVEGLPTDKFFEFHGDLLLNLSKPVDLVDLSTKNRFIKFILRKGQIIFGWTLRYNRKTPWKNKIYFRNQFIRSITGYQLPDTSFQLPATSSQFPKYPCAFPVLW